MRKRLRVFGRLTRLEQFILCQMIGVSPLVNAILGLVSLRRVAGWVERAAGAPVIRHFPLLAGLADLMTLAHLSQLAVAMAPCRRGHMVQSLIFLGVVRSRGRAAQMLFTAGVEDAGPVPVEAVPASAGEPGSPSHLVRL